MMVEFEKAGFLDELHVSHDFFPHFEVLVSLESSGLSSNINLALVRMPFQFCGCLLLLISLNFFIASLNFGLAFRSGSVSLMVLNNSGLRGLKVVTKARMFSSAESFNLVLAVRVWVFSLLLQYCGVLDLLDILACINFLVVLLCVFGGFFLYVGETLDPIEAPLICR